MAKSEKLHYPQSAEEEAAMLKAFSIEQAEFMGKAAAGAGITEGFKHLQAGCSALLLRTRRRRRLHRMGTVPPHRERAQKWLRKPHPSPCKGGEDKPLIFTVETEEYMLDALREQMEAATDPARQTGLDGWDLIRLGVTYIKKGKADALDALCEPNPSLQALCITAAAFLDEYTVQMLNSGHERYTAKTKKAGRKNG